MAWPLLLPVLTGVGNALRVPAIAAFLAGLATQVLGWFTVRFSRRVAMNLTVVAMVIGIALTFIIALKGLVAGLSYVAPPTLSQSLSLFIPSNAIPCISVILAAKVMRWVWVWQFYAINKVSSS